MMSTTRAAKTALLGAMVTYALGCTTTISSGGTGGASAGGTSATGSAGGTSTGGAGGASVSSSSSSGEMVASSSSSSTGGSGGGCASPAECPGVDTPCQARTCAAGQCGLSFMPSGTPVPTQIAGDCRLTVCDGSGAEIDVADDTDVPIAAVPCIVDTCNAGAPETMPATAGTTCHQGSGKFCNGNGTCVECLAPTDCPSGVCSQNTCEPSCNDGVKDGSETDIDCGGSCPHQCFIGQSCLVAADCLTNGCISHECIAIDCFDGVLNGTETDVDCGGAFSCGPCGAGQKCLIDSDCLSHICTAGICAAPSCTDGKENGLETDLDCGGGCPKCATGQKCKVGSDCQSGECSGSLCQP